MLDSMALPSLYADLRENIKHGNHYAIGMLAPEIKLRTVIYAETIQDLMHDAVEPLSRQAVLELRQTMELLIKEGASVAHIKVGLSALERAVTAALRMMDHPKHPNWRDFEVVSAWFDIISFLEDDSRHADFRFPSSCPGDKYTPHTFLAAVARLDTYSDGNQELARSTRCFTRRFKLSLRDWTYIAALRPAAANAANIAAKYAWTQLDAREKRDVAKSVSPMFWPEMTAWEILKDFPNTF